MSFSVLYRAARQLLPVLAVGALVSLAAPGSARAASTILVTTTADELNSNSACSLREALQAAKLNQAVGGCSAGGDGEDTITLPSGTFSLTRTHDDTQAEITGDWNISSDVIIQGAGSSKTFIDAKRSDRAFTIVANRATLHGMTVKNGRTRDPYENGGGIFLRSGILMAQDLVVTASDGFSGGAIYVDRGAYMVINNSTLSYNKSVQGGAVYNAGSADIKYSVLRSNATRYESPSDTNGNAGGAIYNIGELSVGYTTVDSNTSLYGGGILNVSQEKTAYIYASTISNNRADDGGGIANSSGLLRIVSTTISGNRAKVNGAGLHNNGNSCAPNCPGVVSINSATITNNRADSDYNGSGDGGGIYNANYDGGDRVRFANTIVGKNFDSGNQAPECAGSISSYGYNLIANTKGCTLRNTSEGNKLNVDPKLGWLSNNGGRTKMHSLQSGSPAIDTGSQSMGFEYGCLENDQRTVRRPQDGNGDGASRCDIGAFERQPSQASVNDVPQVTLPVEPIQREDSIENVIPSEATE